MAKRSTRKSLRPAAPDAQVHREDPAQPALDHVSHHKIAARAYEIYLARNGMSGNDIGDWLQAERELCYPNSQG